MCVNVCVYMCIYKIKNSYDNQFFIPLLQKWILLRFVLLMIHAQKDWQEAGHCYWSGCHYDDVIMGAIGSQITSLTIVYSTVYSGADQSKHQSSASPAFVWGIHRGPVNSPHKWPVTRKMFPFYDVIMVTFEGERHSLLSIGRGNWIWAELFW